MPIYEYRCEACGTRVEAIQKLSDGPLTTCEACGGSLQRLLSAPAIRFKGEGWYINDYSSKGRDDKAGEKADSGEKKSSEKKDSGAEKASKKESKPTGDSAGGGKTSGSTS